MIMWNATAIRGDPKRHQEHSLLTHVTDIDSAVLIVRNGSIKPHPEREDGKVLLDKPIEVVWLSPNKFSGNFYGCIAFDFDWNELVRKYGDYIYGLEEIEGRTRRGDPIWRSRILLSDSDRSGYFGASYSPRGDAVPWKTHKSRQYIKNDCVLQIGVTRPISLDYLKSIRFINHKENMGQIEMLDEDAARLFLARAVSEHLASISRFSGIDPDTNLPYEPLLYAWRRLWNDIWDEYKDGQGKITSDDEIAETLARSFLDRYGRLQRPKQQPEVFVNDARNIASLFRSRKDLILSIRRAVGRWAKIGKLKRLNSERWPPWENAGRRRTNE